VWTESSGASIASIRGGGGTVRGPESTSLRTIAAR
jgi:hypothetical protein